MRPVAVVLLMCCFLLLPLVSTAQTTAQSEKSAPATSSTPHDDLSAMKQDLARMRALLSQLQTNLGNVSTTTQPLRHQFELENEMWLTLINQMERRVEKMERESKK